MANGNGEGGSVRLTRATLALILALSTPIATVAIVGYQVREHEAMLKDHEDRMRKIESLPMRVDGLADRTYDQTQQIKELRKDVQELTRQIDKATMRYVAAFVLSLAVHMWAVKVIAGYIADRVTSYAGPTPMAIDTALCLAALGVVGMILSKYRIHLDD